METKKSSSAAVAHSIAEAGAITIPHWYAESRTMFERPTTKYCVLATALMAASATGHAATITDSITGFINGDEAIPLFDPTLGTLTGVSAQIYSNGSAGQQFDVVNPTNNAYFSVSYNSTATLAVQYGGSTLFDFSEPLTGTGVVGAQAGVAHGYYQSIYAIPGTTIPVNLSSFTLSQLTATPSSPLLPNGGGVQYLALSPLSASFGSPSIVGAPTAYIAPGSVTNYGGPIPIYVTYTYTPASTGGGTGGGGGSPVPIPAAAWLLVSGIGGLGAFARRKRSKFAA